MNLTNQQWQEDISTLTALRTQWGDILDVTNSRLQLEKGKYYSDSSQIILPYPSAVADHLEALINKTAKECFNFLQLSKNNTPAPEFYEKIVDFKREFKYLYKRISNLQYTLRSHPNKSYAERYSALFKLANDFLEQIKSYKSILQKPPIAERPIKHIEYNERTELVSIKWSYPERVPVGETVAAAKKALILAQPKPQPLYIKFISVIASRTLLMIPFIAVGLLTVFKIVLWNPLEWLIRGEVRTISPLRLFTQALKIENRHTEAYQHFTTQIFHRPLITDEVAKAFEQLAPQAKLLDLEYSVLASEDITELADFIEEDTRPGAIPLATYLQTMKQICEVKKIQLQTLHRVTHLYKLYNDIYLNQQEKNQDVTNFLENRSKGLKENADISKPCATDSYISPKILLRLLNAASLSPTCREITLSSSLIELEIVRNFLNQFSYRLKEDCEFKKTYRRYSLI